MTENDPFRLEPSAVRRHFNLAADTYDEAAVLQAEVRRRLVDRLRDLAVQPGRILDAGAGTGAGHPALLERFPDARVVAVDVAEHMLARAPDPPGGRVQALCADASVLPLAAASVDLVFSNLMLQWSDDLDVTFREFRRVLGRGGLLLFSTFGPDTLRELRAAWSLADGYNHVNRFIDMHDVGDALVRSGFAEPVLDLEHFTLTYPDLGALMRDLKAIGARNASTGRNRGLTGRARYAAAAKAYEAWRQDGTLPSTWEVIYGLAWIPAERPDSDPGEVRIPAGAIGHRQA